MSLRNLICISGTGILLLVFCGGCGKSGVEYTEVKRIDEKITQKELKQFLRIVNKLPKKTLPAIPDVYLPLPQWNPSRTLPVNELIHEEQAELDKRWSVEWLAQKLKRHRALQRVLRRENMTVEQFAGMIFSLGAALSKSQLRKDQDLEALIREGEPVVQALKTDDRSFSRLSPSVKYSVVRKAGELTRLDRAKRLKQVPPENVALVREHFEQLKKIFPSEFTVNPLDGIIDSLEVAGLPFEEKSESGFDVEITWDPNSEEAIIGLDTPDVEKPESNLNPVSRMKPEVTVTK